MKGGSHKKQNANQRDNHKANKHYIRLNIKKGSLQFLLIFGYHSAKTNVRGMLKRPFHTIFLIYGVFFILILCSLREHLGTQVSC